MPCHRCGQWVYPDQVTRWRRGASGWWYRFHQSCYLWTYFEWISENINDYMDTEPIRHALTDLEYESLLERVQDMDAALHKYQINALSKNHSLLIGCHPNTVGGSKTQNTVGALRGPEVFFFFVSLRAFPRNNNLKNNKKIIRK